MQPDMSRRRCNLLLVEDQFDLAALMEQALEDGGGQVTHAYSVFDAMGLLEKQTFDGAVLDVELRDGVVFPVADRLAELGIPFLFVSAVYDQLVPQRHRSAAFVAKPFHIAQLQQAVQRVMGDACTPLTTHSSCVAVNSVGCQQGKTRFTCPAPPCEIREGRPTATRRPVRPL